MAICGTAPTAAPWHHSLRKPGSSVFWKQLELINKQRKIGPDRKSMKIATLNMGKSLLKMTGSDRLGMPWKRHRFMVHFSAETAAHHRPPSMASSSGRASEGSRVQGIQRIKWRRYWETGWSFTYRTTWGFTDRMATWWFPALRHLGCPTMTSSNSGFTEFFGIQKSSSDGVEALVCARVSLLVPSVADLPHLGESTLTSVIGDLTTSKKHTSVM